MSWGYYLRGKITNFLCLLQVKKLAKTPHYSSLLPPKNQLNKTYLWPNGLLIE